MTDKISPYYKKLCDIAEKALKKNDNEMAMLALRSASDIAYRYNQFYFDDRIEQIIMSLADKYILKLDNSDVSNDTVVFYDGFGFDTRGLAIIYLEALIALDKKVIYITSSEARNHQPELMRVVGGGEHRHPLF